MPDSDSLMMGFPEQDQFFMQAALAEAGIAESLGEVPIGAVVVLGGQIIGQGHNLREISNDPTTHAEIIAIQQTARQLNSWRLLDCTLYVTLEPCVMCMGAIVHARVRRLVFGATDPKRGAVCSVLHLTDADFLNHNVAWTGGVLEELCAQRLKEFFIRKR